LSVNYNVPVRTSRLQQAVNAIDAGPGSGFMRLLDSGGNVLSSLQLARPSATVFAGVATFNGLSLIDPAAAAGGQIVGARVEDSTGTVVISGLTAAGAGSTTDLVFSPTNIIAAGQTVALTAATITGN
jgi:hypothetical protein